MTTSAALPPLDPTELTSMEIDKAVEKIVRHAADLKASDLFILTEESGVRIAVRRLGIVETLLAVPRDFGKHIIINFKAMAGMDISEHRRPTDGRRIGVFDGRRLDLRINCIATLHGEDVAIRMWDHDQGLLGLDELGMATGDLKKLQQMLQCPTGLILVTGPTGTGKTTTLYAALEALNDGTRKINTLEDPIEYALAGVRQSQVVPKIGIGFPELLRSILRQAPDVIMVGEIRDEGTAHTAVRAANSGHLVLATLHSPVAASAVQSMLALGTSPFFLSSCLLGVVAQRLVRTLCPSCRMTYDISESPQTFEEIRNLLNEGEGSNIFGPSGCEACFQQGYAGRTGLFEIMTMNQEIRRLIAASRPAAELQQAAIKTGMTEFHRSALLKVAQGVTSTEEILRDLPAEHLGLED
jgi:type II secretory ATPase GspE/PulE/Tfp pilus assembly ATPase PilB-like protein